MRKRKLKGKCSKSQTEQEPKQITGLSLTARMEKAKRLRDDTETHVAPKSKPEKSASREGHCCDRAPARTAIQS
ncbi:hypothetical protein GUJ93_ZPchr0007g5032 [Zizania palustris]|uniref:Uncharacterized protein n=1 Tax=Zizania palustris TaxID=103762 RepID=A0A8J5SQV7_ZIZPA|nr:hypothetical protein GUJ93_ZPchr0007g5032 [Zizania palustris]